MTRNYSKKTKRYRMGGVVPYEDVPELDDAARVPPVDLNRGPGTMELEKHRGKMIDREPDKDYEEKEGDENPSKEDERDA